MRNHRAFKTSIALLAVVIAGAALAACGSSSSSSGSSSTTKAGSSSSPVTLRLGYFPNLTHAPALVGHRRAASSEEPRQERDAQDHSRSTPAPTSSPRMFADALDASFIGPSPAISGFQKSNGKAMRIVAGSTSGGAYLVVKPGINSAPDLKGKTIADPAARQHPGRRAAGWLKRKGLKTDTSGGGDVPILPQDNALTLTTFEAGDIDGAWVPEPWATRLVKEGGGKILVDEKRPSGRTASSSPPTSSSAPTFLNAHPDVVKQLLEGEIDAIELHQDQPGPGPEARRRRPSRTPPASRSPRTWWPRRSRTMTFTVDPIAISLVKAAKDADRARPAQARRTSRASTT